MDTPIIFIIFNRPDTTKLVFEAIRKAKPKKLYVIADGPRKNNSTDEEKCEETRKIIASVDWDCEIIKDFSEKNLGCKKRVSSGITNAFKHFNKAIILEDDCLPNQSFFRFCEEMLEKYEDNEKIMSISGDNFLFEKSNIIKNSYYFSAYPHIWGWATWKRAWEKYDIEMKNWPEAKKQKLINPFWGKRFQDVYLNKIDTWDIQWTFSCLQNKGLTVIPNVNLISNIGFTQGASHTKIKTFVSGIETVELLFPLSHPKNIVINEKADKISQFHFTRTGIIIDLIKSIFK